MVSKRVEICRKRDFGLWFLDTKEYSEPHFLIFCVELILYFPEIEKSGPLYAQNGLKTFSKRLFHFAEPKIAKKPETLNGHISAT